MWTKRVIVLILTSMLTKSCLATKGLFIVPGGSKSHIIFYTSIIDALTLNGHEITFVSPYKATFEGPNVRNIVLPDDYVHKMFGNSFQSSFIEYGMAMARYVPESCVKALTNPEVKNVMKEDYHYIILPFYFSSCFLSFVDEKKVPLIYVSHNVLMNPYSERIGLPEFSSVTPNMFTPFTYPMTFWQRIISALEDVFMSHMLGTIAEGRTERLCRELQLWSPETPSIFDLLRKAKLTIVNSIRALEIPARAIPPNVVYAGGIHIKPTQRLPKDLEEWLNESGESGFILFSLGSMMKRDHMKEEDLQSIVNVFGSLKQRIIWSWASDIKDLPSNVKISSWLPQQAILAHPKIRLFITHGGLFSSQEATYFGVPIIGMPLFADQAGNVAKSVAEGWGRQMTWKDLTEETFRQVITETLTNTSVLGAVKHRSKLMKDWPSNPSEEVVFWVEYIVRHNGAAHFQSPFISLAWYQIYNLDVWFFIASCTMMLLVLLAFVMRTCLRCCFRKWFTKRKQE